MIQIDDKQEFERFDQLQDQVNNLISRKEFADVFELLDKLEPSLRTLLLSRLPLRSRQKLIEKTDVSHAAELIHDLPEVQAVDTVGSPNPMVAATILGELPKDEQADLVGELPQHSQESIYAAMGAANASEVRHLAGFDDEEAGGMMLVHFVSVQSTQTLGCVIEQLQANSDRYNELAVQYLYVVDSADKLAGVLPLRTLVLSPRNSRVHQVMLADTASVHVNDRLTALHDFFSKHRFTGVPVVDDDRRIVGVLRRGDVEAAMADHYAEDYLKTQGIIEEEIRTMPLTIRSRRRLAWLSINLVLNLLAATVIAFYQETLAQVIALAVFLPMISDMSGCSGSQAVAVSMRELSLGLLNSREVM